MWTEIMPILGLAHTYPFSLFPHPLAKWRRLSAELQKQREPALNYCEEQSSSSNLQLWCEQYYFTVLIPDTLLIIAASIIDCNRWEQGKGKKETNEEVKCMTWVLRVLPVCYTGSPTQHYLSFLWHRFSKIFSIYEEIFFFLFFFLTPF